MDGLGFHDRSAEISRYLSVLANEKRFAIVVALLEGERSVGTMADDVGLSQSALSQHLARLREIGIVDTRRDRTMIFYACRSPLVRRLVKSILDTFASERRPDDDIAIASTQRA